MDTVDLFYDLFIKDKQYLQYPLRLSKTFVHARQVHERHLGQLTPR